MDDTNNNSNNNAPFIFGAQPSPSGAHRPATSISPRSATLSSSPQGRAGDGSVFSSFLRERQAKGRDPFNDNHGTGAEWPYDDAYVGQFEVRDRFEASERRLHAASVLGNPELLMMYAQSFNDSITGTKLYFTRMLCGFDDEDDPRTQGPKQGPCRSPSMAAPAAVQRSDTHNAMILNAQR